MFFSPLNHWRLHFAALLSILFSCTLPTPASGGEEAGNKTGAIEGRIVFRGQVPKDRFADDTGGRRPLLSVHRRSGALQYAIVYLDLKPTAADRKKPAKDRSLEKTAQPPEIDQKEHTFVPHLIAIRDGQKVIFTNSDSANHNIRTTSLNPKNLFNVYSGGGGRYEHLFHSDAKNRPIRLSCDIHPWMRGWIYVFEHPFYAVTDKKGKFRIANVPPGKYQLIVRQPNVAFQRQLKIHVAAGKTTRTDVVIEAKDLKSR